MKRVIMALGAGLVLFAAGCGDDSPSPQNFTATLAPVNMGTGSGTAALTLLPDGTAQFTLNASGFSGSVDAAHIHRPGVAPSIVLYSGPAVTTPLTTSGSFAVPAGLVDEMAAGTVTVDVHQTTSGTRILEGTLAPL